MKFSHNLFIFIIFLLTYKNYKYTVSSFRHLNTHNTHDYNLKCNILKSLQKDYVNVTPISTANTTLDIKKDYSLKSDWIPSKFNNEKSSSAYFDWNFKDLFPSRRYSKGGVLLDVKDASIWLGDRILFEKVSFSVNTGECVGIVGNNGVGKSSMFDAIYDRLSGANSAKDSMSISLDVTFNVKDDSRGGEDYTQNSHLYSFILKLMEVGQVTAQELAELYENFEESESKVLPIYSLSGVGYMRQNYTLDLDHNATVSELISRVFVTYNSCNKAIEYVEANLEYFNSLISVEQCSKIASDILSLYNSEGKLMRQRLKEMNTLISKLLPIFGMESMVESRVGSLSGGFKMRLYLFLLLLHSPNLLLLDEPTNNLDTTTVKFLIDVLNYLMKNTKLSVLVVSHDTRLLNSICTSIFQMTGDGSITPYRGNFDDFVLKGTSEKNIRNARIEKLRKNINTLSKDIEELRVSQKGSKKALKVTISQKEELLNKYQEELDGLVGSPLSKYTKTYNRVLFNDSNSFNAIFQKMLNKNAILNRGQMLNSFGPLFKLIDVTLDTEAGKRVFEKLNLTVYPTDRIVLLGDNGIGKTTLLKLLFKSQASFRDNPILSRISSIDRKIMNEDINNNRVERGSKTWELFEKINKYNRETMNDEHSVYEAGDIEYRILVNEPFNFKLVEGLMSVNQAKLSYYSQNCSNILNYKKTVYSLLREYVGDRVDMELLTDYMGCFHLRDYVDSQVSDLSFGERSRLLLSLLLINKSHFLLLDEPTNHLDLFMKKVLKLVVNSIYKGGFMIATHDLDFIRDLSTVNAFVYIYSKDRVFKFSQRFGEEYLNFKSEYPDADRAKTLEFLNRLSRDKSFTSIDSSVFEEELKTVKRQPRKKKTHPPRDPNDRSRIKNIKRWK
ncbi:uncharacterized protein TOT_010001326 [Theileria orientalis strain Shintoku]|uniref:ABC transporter domain-containing protein n=1 Tax=Theileria orientalis strain Shintoku TaxID=869250 RepID=J4DNS2_THEOR|nr:uncharacterized protein TOT_010001326 [Theileria orientalis strain Shintoku]BAM39454.1 uncharacterized protein TOT_010001326 [Theileria orientalis strain Shintoku]|eukprot:XP_009689755.1 uncharacterized protein TOT_010001326 [Theileria orientalis strain Shintoku]